MSCGICDQINEPMKAHDLAIKYTLDTGDVVDLYTYYTCANCDAKHKPFPENLIGTILTVLAISVIAATYFFFGANKTTAISFCASLTVFPVIFLTLSTIWEKKRPSAETILRGLVQNAFVREYSPKYLPEVMPRKEYDQKIYLEKLEAEKGWATCGGCGKKVPPDRSVVGKTCPHCGALFDRRQIP